MSFFGDLITRFRPKKDDDEEEEISSSGADEVAGISTEDRSEKQQGQSPSYVEFLAPACHYDEHTLLNKGGGLVQIIKVASHAYGSSLESLRDSIRASISDVRDPRFSFWIYTVRRKGECELEWRKTNDFSDTLHQAHKASVSTKSVYENEVYIAVVAKHLREGLEGLPGALMFRSVKKKHKNFLVTRAERLSKATESIVEKLQRFSARKLGLIRCQDGRWRSELLEFLSYVVTLRDRECFLESRDSAYTIAEGCEFVMGFNSLKVSEGGSSKYGAILGIKEYIGDSLDAVDMCLQQECEFIIVEVLIFVESKEVKDAYRKQAELLEISGDTELAELGRLEEIMSADEASIGDCCKRKMSCTVISDSMQSLKRDIHRMVSSFSAVGAIVVRIDLAMEDYFWANIPGNFRYVLGVWCSMVKSACTFAMTHHFPSGTPKGGRWSEAITLFFSNRNLPYFFSFHSGKNGHTMCLGPQNSSMTALMNFILSESRRLNVRSVVFDYSGKSIIFAAAINGEYYRIDDKPGSVSKFFNPFNVQDTAQNREIATGVLQRMISPYGVPSQELMLAIQDVVDQIFAIPLESRTPDEVRRCIGTLGGHARAWQPGGKFAHLITDTTDLKFGAEFLSINAGVLVSKRDCIGAVLYYLLRSLENSFDGKPTILVMYEIWITDLVFLTEAELDNWVERLSQLNVVVVFAAENIKAMTTSKVVRYASKHIETRIFMPNVIIDSQQHIRMFGLSREEVDIMLQIPQHEGHFFVKQGGSSVVLVWQLPDKEIRVLSANRSTIKLMYEAIAEKGRDWMAAFHEKCERQQK
ncbi:MAG: VirB4 family type IV secretion system protein [Anaplasma sp.]